MDKKYIFNSDESIYTGDLFKMKNLAKDRGFKFFLFNGIIYIIIEDEAINTGLEKNDIK